VPQQHQVQGFLEFARALGVPVRAPRWDLPISEAATTWALEQVGDDDPVLLISPCSSHPLRNWRAEYYARVADQASQHSGLKIVLSGGPSAAEQAMAAEIESLMQQPCLNLVGKDTLEQSKALLRRADLVITPDSGPAHIASALETPVIGLHAATWSRRSGPYNSLDLCVDHFEEAARKFRGKAAGELRWGTRIEEPGVMDLVRPEEVIQRITAAGY
jgi:heptosyltransferase I